ncbi:REP-associated tyrosine transposase, partial [Anabaena sp. UHCC 0451]|uniref:REP-associated tyrosine transposase n=1 Tax=Anabaena sp. UHCC 0451 TaxID=2055235 RepID=UPI002B201F6E
MPRRTTPLESGNFYHIYNRGNNRQNIFFERENYIYFLRLLKEHLTNNAVDIIAYCLMPNHYHLLVYLRDESLSDAMKSLSLAYTKAINKRFNRSGVLFQGRFQSIPVSQTEYLFHLSRYIHLNPVKAGIVDKPGEWEFSSYLEYAGLRLGKIPKLEYLKMHIEEELAYQLFLLDHNLPNGIGFKRLLLD